MVPDFYVMLGVDPRADRAVIEAALQRCQPQWSAGTRNPKTKHTYQSYLDQIPALRRALLGDSAERAAYDAELGAARRAGRDRALDELQRLVRLRAAKGGLTVSDRGLLRDEAVRLGVPDDEFRRLIEPIPPRPETPAESDGPEPPRDVIEPAVRRQIRLALEHLRRPDLYAVLDLPRDAPAREIAERADAARRRWMQKSQVTAEKTAWLEAISYAQSHLVPPEARARYDRTLAVEAEEAFAETLGFALRGLGQLDAGTKGVLLDEGARLGIGPDRAARLLRRACRQAGVSADGGPAPAGGGGPPPRLLRCRACGGVTAVEADARRLGPVGCRYCGASLRWDCAVCRHAHLIDEARCGCGFLLAHLEPVLQHFEAAQHAFRARDYAGSLAALERVLELAPRHPAARKAADRVRQRAGELEQLRSAYEMERGRRAFVAARGVVESWARLADPAEPALAQARVSVQQALHESATLTARADELARSDPAAARTLYIKALGLVRDDPAPAEGLRRCPPDPPADLRATCENGRVRLRWTAAAPDGLGKVGYRVLRKRGGVPAHVGDGIPVGDFAAVECEDAAPGAGEAVGYGVFSLRGDAASVRGATAGPVLVLGEVTDVRVDAGSREVRLAWSPPPGAVGVRVLRRDGPGRGASGEAVAIDVQGPGAIDRGVEDGRAYTYTIVSLFRSADGGEVASRGVEVGAVPHSPRDEVEALSIAREGPRGVRLSWPHHVRGEVSVIRTPRPLAYVPGSQLPRAEVARIEGRWLAATENNHAFDPDPPASGHCYYTPLTSWGATATIGRGTAYSCVADPADLRATRAEVPGRFHLRWRWMHGGGSCLVLARRGGYPAGPDDPEAMRFVVTEPEYGRLGYFPITLPAGRPGPWHVLVLAAAGAGGVAVYSQGLGPTARRVLPASHAEVTVSYRLRPPRLLGRLLGRRWSVTFRTDPPGQSIPATALVGHSRTIPLSADDGEVIQQFPAARDGECFRIEARRNLRGFRLRMFVDPHSDPNALQPVKIRHPDPGGVRV